MIPRSRGGCDRVSSLAVVCRMCNEAKGNRIPEHGWKN
ncbi:HNH endonuclease [Thermogemmatispora sp.]